MVIVLTRIVRIAVTRMVRIAVTRIVWIAVTRMVRIAVTRMVRIVVTRMVRIALRLPSMCAVAVGREAAVWSAAGLQRGYGTRIVLGAG